MQSKIAVYLAAGRPIVATDFGDYQALLGASGAGLLTPVAPIALADGIMRVLTDSALAARLAATTRPVAREYFAMDRNIDRYLDVYRRAIAARSSRDVDGSHDSSHRNAEQPTDRTSRSTRSKAKRGADPSTASAIFTLTPEQPLLTLKIDMGAEIAPQKRSCHLSSVGRAQLS